MADDKPIIVIKKKGGHGGHHGGAWKIAYADFVTAMMAFFMVMWLVNSAEVTTRQNIASYFRKPGLFQTGSGTPLMIGEAGILEDAFVPAKKDDKKNSSGKNQDPSANKNQEQQIQEQAKGRKGDEKKFGTGKADVKSQDTKKGAGISKDPGTIKLERSATLLEPKPAPEALGTAAPTTAPAQKAAPPTPIEAENKAFREAQKAYFENIAEEIRKQVGDSPELQRLLGIVDVKIDADGLNIEIMDTDQTSMFASGSPRIQAEAQAAFTKIGEILRKLPNTIDIVGHTDAKPFASRNGGYSNWELSGDRANSARKLLESQGIATARITSVVGRADREPRNSTNPFAPENRRITLKMKFNISKRINLGKDPNAITRAQNEPPPAALPSTQAAPTSSEIPAQTAAPGTAQPAAANPAAPAAEQTEQTVHSLTPKKVIQGKQEQANDRYRPKQLIKANEKNDNIQVPEEGAATPNSTNKIFGTNPVLGPNDPFANF